MNRRYSRSLPARAYGFSFERHPILTVLATAFAALFLVAFILVLVNELISFLRGLT